MKAQTLAVCLPGSACNKKCPYCVSKMTWAPAEDEKAWCLNLPKVVHFARMAQVTDVIITGKGEPTINGHLTTALSAFQEWPTVVQTNGIHWAKLSSRMTEISHMVNVVAVSVDDPEQMKAYAPLWQAALNASPLTCRITVMLTPEVCRQPFQWWAQTCKELGICGLTFREITIPGEVTMTREAHEVATWVEGLASSPNIAAWKESFEGIFSDRRKPVIRRLPYGAVIKDFMGVSVTKFDFCLQDSNGDDDIRSLVYNQDGHLYTTWSSPASLIF